MFWFRLAGHLGMSVAEAQQRISAEEFAEWIAFNQHEPIGRQLTDTLLAQIPYVIVSMFKGKKGRRPRLADFLPSFGPKKRQSTADAVASLNMFVKAHNAGLTKRGRKKV